MRKILLFAIAVLVGASATYFLLRKGFDARVERLAVEIDSDKTDLRKQELMEAWHASKSYTMEIVDQMPDEYFAFKYTPEAMTFAEQWRHCCIFTCSQIASKFNLDDSPYEDLMKRPPVEMGKEAVKHELEKTYNYVFKVIKNLPEKALFTPVDFASDALPGWRFIYAMDNHIIHHRGQCIVYLRLKGIKPIGYIGW
jgi:hypothetical protein